MPVHRKTHTLDRPRHRRRGSRPAIVVLTVATALLAAACSSSSGSGAGSSSPDRSGPAASGTSPAASSGEAAKHAPYAQPGPYAVGTQSFKLADGRKVVVWYPVAKGQTAGHPQESIDITSYLSPALQAKVPASSRVTYTTNAYVGAPPDKANGPYPIILFSHGFAGYPEQSVFLTTHLASWGYVVAAPDHVERSLDGLLGGAGAGIAKSTDSQVLLETLKEVKDGFAGPDGAALVGLADTSRPIVTGHSAGANAAYRLASEDPSIKAFISYSAGFDAAQDKAPPTKPTQPGMVMLGTQDGIIPPAATRALYAGMASPKHLVEIGGAGHLVFSDICLIGRSNGGITGIAKQLKLGIPDQLLRLGSDGCTGNALAPERSFPAQRQLSVAFIRSVLGQDPKPVGLDTAAVADLGAPVTVTQG